MTSRKIQFYTLTKSEYDDGRAFGPATDLKEVLEYVSTLEPLAKQSNLNTRKFCQLHEITSPQKNYLAVSFKSASDGYSSALLNRRTGKERVNPKALEEGERAITHAVIKFTTDETLICLEHGKGMLTIQQIVNYLNRFGRNYYASINESSSLSYGFEIILKNNFLEEVRNLYRIVEGELTISKSVLGDEALNYSGRTSEVKESIKLIVTASRGRTIVNTIADAYNKLNARRTTIERIKVKGKNEEGDEVLINSDKIARMEFVEVEIIQATGEVKSESIFPKLLALARNT